VTGPGAAAFLAEIGAVAPAPPPARASA
jgi:hypothetical protein